MGNQLYCNNFEDHVQSLMDQRLPLAEDTLVQGHAKQCRRCNELLESFSALEFALNEVFSVGDFDAAINNQTTANQFAEPLALRLPSQNHQTARWIAVGSALAIAVVLMLLIPTVMIGDRSIADEKTKGLAVAVLDSKDKLAAGSNGSARSSIEPIVVMVPEAEASTIDVESYDVYESIPLSLRNAYGYAAQLPGVRPLECSFTVTIEMIQKSFDQFSGQKQAAEEPDLGHYICLNDSRMV